MYIRLLNLRSHAFVWEEKNIGGTVARFEGGGEQGCVASVEEIGGKEELKFVTSHGYNWPVM